MACPSGGRLLFAAALVTACVGLVALPAGAFDESSNPCALISKDQFRKDVGLSNVREAGDVGLHGAKNASGFTGSRCRIVAWSGKIPATQAQTYQKLIDGTGATVYIGTLITDPTSSQAADWETRGFRRYLTMDVLGCSAVGHGPHGQAFAFPLDGAQSVVGYENETRAVVPGAPNGAWRSVCGVWDRTDSHRIILILFSGSERKPVASQFRKIAKTVVERFWSRAYVCPLPYALRKECKVPHT